MEGQQHHDRPDALQCATTPIASQLSMTARVAPCGGGDAIEAVEAIKPVTPFNEHGGHPTATSGTATRPALPLRGEAVA